MLDHARALLKILQQLSILLNASPQLLPACGAPCDPTTALLHLLPHAPVHTLQRLHPFLKTQQLFLSQGFYM